MAFTIRQKTKADEWCQTSTGKQFWPLHPNVEDLDINDIAHSLSNLCRYNGHVREFYSVAEHSVLVANTVSKPNKLWALLHDASEAYICDIPDPIKHRFSGYIGLETNIMKVVARKFNLALPIPKEVLDADKQIILNEQESLFDTIPVPWVVTGDKIKDIKIQCLTPSKAKSLFLATFNEITKV